MKVHVQFATASKVFLIIQVQNLGKQFNTNCVNKYDTRNKYSTNNMVSYYELQKLNFSYKIGFRYTMYFLA